MKKKIKNLTIQDIIKLGEKHNHYCINCPLNPETIPCHKLCELSYISKYKLNEEWDKKIKV